MLALGYALVALGLLVMLATLFIKERTTRPLKIAAVGLAVVGAVVLLTAMA